VKRIFPIIIILITLSLIGIIIIQLSWIKNMLLVREDFYKGKVMDATKMVGEELAMHKGSYSSSSRLFPDVSSNDFSLELLKPVTVGQRFSANEIQEKIYKAFKANAIEDVRFEFGLATVGRRELMGVVERQSKNFISEFNDSLHNIFYGYPLNSPSGTPAENLSPDEILYVVVPNIKDIVMQSLRWRIATAIVFTLIIVAAFYLTVTTMLRQKKMSEIKNDFINNMTHEFKTPLATISLAVDALRNDRVVGDREKMSYFSNIIKEENLRMNRQVETILKAALLDRQEVELNLRPLHAHGVIHDVVDNFALQLQEKNGKAEILLDAKNDLIDADEVHFSNLVNNLIDNSLKYAKENVPPDIKISSQSNDKSFILKLEDNGIGMSKETVKRIFEKFYRAHTGNLHNVKGFGLGLSYVKTMVEAHGGDIKAESTLGKGSSFTIELPLKQD
jgi:two-component system, OmpR family, phosphate regulon sensor histidine kinase PhoR